MIDTIVCDKQAEQAAVALLGDGNVKEIEFVNEARAAEGSIYLGKITHKPGCRKTAFMKDRA